MKTRTEQLKESYRLEAHPEGGWFAEVYTAPFEKDGRELAGSIWLLLDAAEKSQFHQIDCEELWFYHEGCGVRITVLCEGRKRSSCWDRTAPAASGPWSASRRTPSSPRKT